MNRYSLLITLGLLSATNAYAITFDRACERGDTITIAAVGDVLLHKPLQTRAFGSSDTHGALWRGVKDLIEGADLAYANLEGPTASGISSGGRSVKDPGMQFGTNGVYTGYPLFNYHPILAWDLKKAGFDIVSTANNHSMDRGPIGVDKTLETLEAANLPAVGTRTRAQADRGEQPWHVVTRKKGWSIAWIACSFSTNGNADPKRQVLGCFRDADRIEGLVRSLSASSSIDAVIVTPHWGEKEYTQKIEPSQRALAKRFLEAGATGIFGNHPHVTKPWEKIVTRDGRETLVIYSIGNFVSNQRQIERRTSAIVYLGLTKTSGKKAWINGVTYVPTYMFNGPAELVASDRSSRVPDASAKVLAKLLGADRRIDSRGRIETNPECN
jgi:poly-gamma-glutamate synthesis protein (capsule biosynthesis protein)